jgi:hypothetical protein
MLVCDPIGICVTRRIIQARFCCAYYTESQFNSVLRWNTFPVEEATLISTKEEHARSVPVKDASLFVSQQ